MKDVSESHVSESHASGTDDSGHHFISGEQSSEGFLLQAITYDANGLVPAIVQDVHTKAVLMMAWMTSETLMLTMQEGRTVFWSRSRQVIWRKGETSGSRQLLRAAYYDCDGDTLLFKVEQEGSGACHTGRYSCFYRDLGRDFRDSQDSQDVIPAASASDD